MEKFLKTFGLIVVITIIWSIIFYVTVNKNNWPDLGVLEAATYLIATAVASPIGLLMVGLFYFIFFKLKKNKTIKIDNNIIFCFGYLFEIAIVLMLSLYISTRIGLRLNIETISQIFYVPLIHSIICFSCLTSFMKIK